MPIRLATRLQGRPAQKLDCFSARTHSLLLAQGIGLVHGQAALDPKLARGERGRHRCIDKVYPQEIAE